MGRFRSRFSWIEKSESVIASTSEARLRRCLSGIRFPANKQDLLAEAIVNGCDEDTVEALRHIAPTTYTNLRQVLASVTIVDIPTLDADTAGGHDRDDANDTPS